MTPAAQARGAAEVYPCGSLLPSGGIMMETFIDFNESMNNSAIVWSFDATAPSITDQTLKKKEY